MSKELDALRRDVVIRYENTTRPKIWGIRPNRDIALNQMYEWGDYALGEPGKIIDITVDGEVFTIDDLRKR